LSRNNSGILLLLLFLSLPPMEEEEEEEELGAKVLLALLLLIGLIPPDFNKVDKVVVEFMAAFGGVKDDVIIFAEVDFESAFGGLGYKTKHQ